MGWGTAHCVGHSSSHCKEKRARKGVEAGRFCMDCAAYLRTPPEETPCYYCKRPDVAATPSRCGYTKGCTEMVSMCARCLSVSTTPVCGTCYKKHWAFYDGNGSLDVYDNTCFRCKEKMARKGVEFGRFCKDCAAYLMTPPEETPCYYCQRPDVAATPSRCGHTKGCTEMVPMCARCLSVSTKPVCSTCYKKHWAVYTGNGSVDR